MAKTCKSDATRTRMIELDNATAEELAYGLAVGGRAMQNEFFSSTYWTRLCGRVTRNATRARTTATAIDAVTGSAHGGPTTIGRLHEIVIASMLKVTLGRRYNVELVRMAHDIRIAAPTGRVQLLEAKSAQWDPQTKSTGVDFTREQLSPGTHVVIALYQARGTAVTRYIVTDADTIMACMAAAEIDISPNGRTKLPIAESDSSAVWSILKRDLHTPRQAMTRLKAVI